MSAATQQGTRVPLGCKYWCASTNKRPWSVKCTWRQHCGACPQCAPATSMQSTTTATTGGLSTASTTGGLSTASTASTTRGPLVKSTTTERVSTVSTTFTTRMQSITAGKCDSWCVGHAQNWEDKCTWETCNMCTECDDITTKSRATTPIPASNTQNESKPNTNLTATSNNSVTISKLTTTRIKERSTARSAANTPNFLASTVSSIDNAKESDAGKTQVDILLISVIIGIAIVILLLVVVIVLASVMKVTLQNKKKKARKAKTQQNQKSKSNDARVDLQHTNTQTTKITDTQGQAPDHMAPPKLPQFSPNDSYGESAYTLDNPSVAYSEAYTSPTPQTSSVAYTEGYSPALAEDAHSRVATPHPFLGSQNSNAASQNTGVGFDRYYDDQSYTERYEDVDGTMQRHA